MEISVLRRLEFIALHLFPSEIHNRGLDPAMQGPANQMIPPLPQAHLMGLNQMHPGPVTSSNIPPNIGAFANEMTNIQGTPTASGLQSFLGGIFNWTQGGQIGAVPGLNAYQPGMMDVRIPGMAAGGNMGLPQPTPLPHSSAPQ